MPNVNSRFSVFRLKIIAILIGFALAAGVALFLVGRSGPGDKEAGFLGGLLAGFGQSVAESDQQSANREPAPVESFERYIDPDYGFSFEIPEGAGVKSFSDEPGDVILVQGSPPAKEVEPPAGGSTSQNFSFQIFITPFDESGPLTAERVKKDLPGLAIQNPRQATLDTIPALAFTSRDPSLGDLYEVWFVHDGSLYQITAPVEQEEALNSILTTWQFR